MAELVEHGVGPPRRGRVVYVIAREVFDAGDQGGSVGGGLGVLAELRARGLHGATRGSYSAIVAIGT